MINLATTVGGVALKSPVMTAAGTSGYGDELAGYGDLSTIGAVVTKSLAAFAWEGNAPPRVAASGEHGRSRRTWCRGVAIGLPAAPPSEWCVSRWIDLGSDRRRVR
jgi:hypothetical protein